MDCYDKLLRDVLHGSAGRRIELNVLDFEVGKPYENLRAKLRRDGENIEYLYAYIRNHVRARLVCLPDRQSFEAILHYFREDVLLARYCKFYALNQWGNTRYEKCLLPWAVRTVLV